MWTICNQASLPIAWKAFEDEGGDGDGRARLLKSGNRERVVDCMEEFAKFTILMRPHHGFFGDRYSEREEKRVKEEKRLRELAVLGEKDEKS